MNPALISVNEGKTLAPAMVALVILNWNGRDDTLACLASVEKIDYPNFHVTVVDNGSTDDSVAAIRAAFPGIEVIETGKNLGFAGGNNVGIRRALEQCADFILVLNNDTVVAPDLLDRLLESAQRNPDAGVFSSRIMYLDDPARVWFDGARWNPSTLELEWPGQGMQEAALATNDRDTDYACGAAFFFRAEVARQIGLLDESFFLVWEEVDWCFRARKAGWRNLVVPAARVWHKVGVSFGSESSPLRTYFSIRNQLLWFSRHARASARIRLWAKDLRRLVPKFLIADGTASWMKRFLWAIQDWAVACFGRGARLEYLATRRAIMDYARQRLGDCPQEVRAWSEAWAEIQRKAWGARGPS